jgi:hypothetical protein
MTGVCANGAGVGPRVGHKFLAGLVIVVVGACNASVQKFDATPRNAVCPGTPVVVVWDVTGSATLTVTPEVADAPNGEVASSGQARFTPSGKTVVSLRVTRCFGEPTGADIAINPPQTDEISAPLTDASTCANGVLTVKAHTQNFDPAAHALSVTAAKRDIDVSREGAPSPPVSLAPGKGTNAFSSLTANGDWIISTKLRSGETCSNPPNSVTFLIYTACEGVTR